MYTKQDLKELRDILLKEMYAGKYVEQQDEGSTARHLAEVLMFQTDPGFLQEKLAAYAQLDESMGQDPNPSATHYKMAYDALFGDISVAPLHINDFLRTVAAWRLKRTVIE